MIRGDIFIGGDNPGRLAVVVTRDWAIPLLSRVTVAGVTRTIRGLPTEVELGPEHGVRSQCVINCDDLATVPKDRLVKHVARLPPGMLRQLDDALRLALALD